jgi:hypothetical protein
MDRLFKDKFNNFHAKTNMNNFMVELFVVIIEFPDKK